MKRETRVFWGVVISVLVVFLICFGRATLSNASSDTISMDPETFDIELCLCQVLMAENQAFSEKYYISNSFSIQGSSVDDNSMYFVFCEGDCIGELVVSPNNQTVSFFHEKCELIVDFYRKQEAFAVACDKDGCVFLVVGERKEPLWGEWAFDETAISQSSDSLPCQLISLREVNTVGRGFYSGIKGVVDISHYLSVPIIPNAAVPNSNPPIGLCWLASSLSMINYYYGFDTGYTTLSLYNYVDQNIQPGPGQTGPTGSQNYIEGTFSLFDLDFVTYYAGGLNFSGVKASIDNDEPILANINESYVTFPGHSVVIRGYSKFSQTGAYFYYSYSLMDPNCSNYVTVAVDGTSSTFTYDTGSNCYVAWISNYR